MLGVLSLIRGLLVLNIWVRNVGPSPPI